MLPFSLANLAQDRKTRSRDEIRNKKWWEDGLQNWSGSQFKKGLRVNRDTFHLILGEIQDLITKETMRFKKPTSPECQLALTLYRMAHGISFSTVGDLLELRLRQPARFFQLLPVLLLQGCTIDLFAFQEMKKNGKKSCAASWKIESSRVLPPGMVFMCI